jgi:1-aminocyclopropane-1-carboxylate deaminase/D-cysteine desulfhydrase-like pyridoxal-dependent ACC family enzyme
VSLAHLPTPLDDCPRLSAQLGVSLHVKREDCTGLAFGGNKVRQHEYVLGKAVADGADCLIQGSAAQSNHSRQLAAAGARLGLEVFLLPKADAHSSPVTGNLLLDHLLGATIAPISPDASSVEAKEALAQRLRAAGRHPYITGMGSDEALVLAAVAYVDALFEIVEDLAPDGAPAWIFTASQGSTQAGLLLGCELLGLPTKVVGIAPMSQAHEAYMSPAEILDIVRAAGRLLGWESRLTERDVRCDGGFVGEGYGIQSPASVEAIRVLAGQAGILLDPVYSGKAFAGLLDYCRRGTVEPGERVVFVHTGGTPALFSYSEALV